MKIRKYINFNKFKKVQVAAPYPDYHLNLFDLSNSKKIWGDEAHPLFAKVIKGIFYAVRDIYIKNPYSFIAGNYSKLFKSVVPQTTLTKIIPCATAVFGAFYVLMLYGSSLHLTGKIVQTLVKDFHHPLLSKAVEKILLVGEKLFVAGAVPIYGVFYALPKHLISFFPMIKQFLAKKAASAAHWIFQNVLTPFCQKLLFPFLQKMNAVIQVISAKVNSVLQVIGLKIAHLASWTFKKLMIPLWNKALLPFLQKTATALEFLFVKIGSALKIVGAKVAHLANWTFKNILIPLWNSALSPCLKFLKNKLVSVIKNLTSALSAVANATSQVAYWTFKNLILPFFNNFIIPGFEMFKSVTYLFFGAVKQSFHHLKQLTKKVASFLFQHFLKPLFIKLLNGLALSGRFVLNYIIKPLGIVLLDLAQKIGEAFNWTLNNVIIPTATSVAVNTSVLISNLKENLNFFNSLIKKSN